MIVTLKTLQQKTFKLEVDDTETVLALKERIEKEQGTGFPVVAQKLIYAGKILNDATQLKEYNISESNFVVVMVSKAKTPAAAKSSQPGASSSTSTAPPSAPQQPTATTTVAVASGESERTQQTSSLPSDATTTDSGTTPVASSSAPVDPTASTEDASGMETAASTLVLGEAYEQAIMGLMEMGGYDRDEVVRAMNASFNNPSRAAEYLMTGIPQDIYQPQEEEGPPPPSQDQPPSAEGQQPAVPVAEGLDPAEMQPGESAIDYLSRQPQFHMLRGMLQTNPGMLQPILQQIGVSNPQLLRAITENQEAFLQLLNHPELMQQVANRAAQRGNLPPGGMGSLGGGAGGMLPPGAVPPGQLPPGAVQIQVTEQEKAAIDRLKALGYSEELVIQAYFACDKNEELAANFLLSQDD